MTPLHKCRRAAGYRTADEFADAVGIDREVYRCCEQDPDFPYGHGRYIWDIFSALRIGYSFDFTREC